MTVAWDKSIHIYDEVSVMSLLIDVIVLLAVYVDDGRLHAPVITPAGVFFLSVVPWACLQPDYVCMQSSARCE